MKGHEFSSCLQLPVHFISYLCCVLYRSYEEQLKQQLAQEVTAAEARVKAAADKSLNSLKDHLQAKLYNVENELRRAMQG